MPAMAPVAQVLKLQFQHLNNAVPVWTHWFLRYTGSAPQATDAAAIANSAKSAWTTSGIAALVPSTISLQLVQCTDLSSPSSAQGVSGGAPVTGSRTGQGTMANDCMLINMHITRRYRGGKPRQYWPGGVVTDIVDAQHWSTAYVNAWQASINALNTALLAITWTGGNVQSSVNVSYFGPPNKVITNPSTGRARNQSTPRSTPLVDVVASFTPSARAATQRRREHFSQ